jgi:hypothetical protein
MLVFLVLPIPVGYSKEEGASCTRLDLEKSRYVVYHTQEAASSMLVYYTASTIISRHTLLSI